MKYTKSAWLLAEQLWREGKPGLEIQEATGIPRRNIYQRRKVKGWPPRMPQQKIRPDRLHRMKVAWESGMPHYRLLSVAHVSRSRWNQIAMQEGWVRFGKGPRKGQVYP